MLVVRGVFRHPGLFPCPGWGNSSSPFPTPEHGESSLPAVLGASFRRILARKRTDKERDQIVVCLEEGRSQNWIAEERRLSSATRPRFRALRATCVGLAVPLTGRTFRRGARSVGAGYKRTKPVPPHLRQRTASKTTRPSWSREPRNTHPERQKKHSRSRSWASSRRRDAA